MKMKQFDLQGNEYDLQIKSMLDAMPKDIEGFTIHFTEKDLLEGFREEALKSREGIEELKKELELEKAKHKELRDYIEERMSVRKNCENIYSYDIRNDDYIKQVDKLLEILDKENKNV